MKTIITVLLLLVCINGYGHDCPDSKPRTITIQPEKYYDKDGNEIKRETYDFFWCGCLENVKTQWQDHDKHAIEGTVWICHKLFKYKQMQYLEVKDDGER